METVKQWFNRNYEKGYDKTEYKNKLDEIGVNWNKPIENLSKSELENLAFALDLTVADLFELI
jgi:hypothetical protein